MNRDDQDAADALPPASDAAISAQADSSPEQESTTARVAEAANEAAVAAFLDNEISFTDIVAACREILDNHDYESAPDLKTLLNLDLWARQEINKWIAC